MQIKVKTPAKINYTLEILGKRPDGYHEIQSVMQMINLYDYLTFDIEPTTEEQIILSGNSNKIPYNEKNIVYKAIKKFSEYSNITPHTFNCKIEKNIPTEAGLAGGSSNAVGTLIALNSFFNNILSDNYINKICAELGSDLNVILLGGCVFAQGRGEKVSSLPFIEYPVSLIKPNIGISAKEGYSKYNELKDKPEFNNTKELIKCLNNHSDIRNYLYNDIETAIIKFYPELQKIKSANPNSIMSGSGSTYFSLTNNINIVEDHWYKENLKTISSGCEIID